MNNAYRYAIYFAPRPGSAFWEAGSQWLGRCAASQMIAMQPSVPGVSPHEFCQLTAAPRRYGWHATLKAPFSLAPGVPLSSLMTALHLICARVEPFRMPPLQVTRLENFLAMTFTEVSLQIKEIERQCVTVLQPLTAPLSPDELLRRRLAGLTLAQDSLLLRWSYPYVLEHFRFHMSLTGSLRECSELQIRSLMDAGAALFGSMRSLDFDSIALFAEPVKGDDFVLIEHIGLRG